MVKCFRFSEYSAQMEVNDIGHALFCEFYFFWNINAAKKKKKKKKKKIL